MQRRTMVFIDGENLTMRYQTMVDKGYVPESKVVHEKDTYVWHPKTLQVGYLDVIRTMYYTYAVGTDEHLKQINDQLKSFEYLYRPSNNVIPETSFLYPRIFKKNRQSAKRKGVDISIAVDALKHTYGNNIDIAYLMTGDGDYLPLIEEIVSNGKRVYLAAFSDGLNANLPNVVDKFFNLDKIFFEK